MSEREDSVAGDVRTELRPEEYLASALTEAWERLGWDREGLANHLAHVGTLAADADRCQELERDRDLWYHAADIQKARAEAAESLLEEAREALRPFGQGVGAFDRADGTYGDGPVYERLTGAAVWSFTIADARRARVFLAKLEAR